MKKRFIGVYNPTILLTYAGVFCAIVGIGLLLYVPCTCLSKTMDIVMVMLITAGVCDMFDGAVARHFDRTEKEIQFGIQLDSLADTVSFVAFPAIILMSVVENKFISVPIACFYVFAGVMRLGWFNVTTEENHGIYMGLPVTFTAVIFPVSYLVLRMLDLSCVQIVFPALYACVGLLFILNFRLKKLQMPALVFLAIVAIAGTVGLLLI